MSGEDPSSVAVALRVRPLVQSELDRGCRIAVERAADGSPQVTVNRTESYTYNHVFGIEDTQKELFESCVEEKLKRLLNGYNLTILAYGQTGSGKTYTMGTAFNGSLDDHAGVIPRAVHDIFREIAVMSKDYRFHVTCSFVELYQEQFYDLFSTKPRDKATVDIREVKNKIVMPGLTELVVKSAQEVTEYLMRGSAGRAVAATAMNETSSRSHAIFTITLVATKVHGTQSVTTSRFNLVDLAGSERCSKTLASGDRFKEGVNINKGLLALGNVINALGSGQVAGFVRYRDSKLTRLLQDSLGGNSITLMIACVSPADYNVAETLSTLRYADRALQIKNKPVVNLDPHAAEVNMLKDIIQKLRVELLANGKMSSSITSAIGSAGLSSAPSSDADSLSGSAGQAEEIKRLKEEKRVLAERARKLEQELHQSWADLTEKEMRVEIAEHAQEKLRTYVLQIKAKLEQQQQQKAESGDDADDGMSDPMKEISQLVEQVDNELHRTQDELESHGAEARRQLSGRSPSDREENSSSAGDEVQEMMQSQSEEFTNKQLNLAGELRTINRQLDLKKELHDRIMRNYNRLEGDDEGDVLRLCHQKIEDLEVERRDLMDQLRTTKSKDNMAKIAEERRKRLQSLETEIADLRRRVITQANMLKMREKEKEKITNLSGEIRAMKESKVKLIRAMRGESEKFRQWKLVREKELTQLKSKDRKMQSEMVRQQTLHAKQRQVLKRKCEEALATNKRLKDALERQATAQAQRHKNQKDHASASSHGNSSSHAKTDSWVDRELEIILSLVDAEHSLEQLMEDRAVINNHYHLMEKQTSINPADMHEQVRLLAQLEEELEMRNAQIADLQQKVCQSDLDSRIKALAEGVQSIGEARTVSKHLLKSMVQQRRHQAASINEQRTLMDEQRAQLLEAQQNQEAATKRLRLAEAKHEEQMLNLQRNYEEKVAVLLRAANQRPDEGETAASKQEQEQQRQQFLDELVSSREALQLELDTLRSKMSAKKKPKEPEVIPEDPDESVILMSETLELSDVSSDPDWVPSKPKSKNRNNTADRDVSGSALAQDATNGSMQSINSTTPASGAILEDSKRAFYCKCRTRCNSKRCGCFGAGNGCYSGCVCKGHCLNPNNTANMPPPENGQGDAPMMKAEIREEPAAEDPGAGSSEDAKSDGQSGKENFVSPPQPSTSSASVPEEVSKGGMDQPMAASGGQPLVNANATIDDISAPKLARWERVSNNVRFYVKSLFPICRMSGLAFSTPRRKFF
ncbi:hypothetical protein KR026_006261 [Drosophila bipectinata]|nr:hypothetical protein KR026_006261 [Drosophila bipectinata]